MPAFFWKIIAYEQFRFHQQTYNFLEVHGSHILIQKYVPKDAKQQKSNSAAKCAFSLINVLYKLTFVISSF